MLLRATPPKSIHVLVATPAAARGQGGIDRVMASLREELERTDSPVEVRFGATRGPGSLLLTPFYLAGFLLRMLFARATGRLDLVHINLASSGSTYRKLVIAWFARLLDVPYVLHLHGAGYQEFWKNDSSLLSRAIRTMFENAARIIVLGTRWRDFVAARAPSSVDRIVIAPNAAPEPKLEPRGGGELVHILFLGRIGDRKGVPQLGDALAQMRPLPGWRATIAGDGAVEAARVKAMKLGLADRVALPGWVGPVEVAELIASADILVLPSFAENLPLSIVEAMASGLAVVATPVGSVPDIVKDGETGLLVAPGDVEELAAALTRLARDGALRARLGSAAQRFHREHLALGPYADSMWRLWASVSR